MREREGRTEEVSERERGEEVAIVCVNVRVTRTEEGGS